MSHQATTRHIRRRADTYCLVFRPGVITDFAAAAVPQPHDPDAPLVRVGSKLATAG